MREKEPALKFFNRVRTLRKGKGMTVEDLAAKSGVSLQMLKQLDQNVLPEEMMVDDAFLLAKAFECKPYELFE